MLETVMFINPENNLGLVLFSFYVILGAFLVVCNVWAGLCHLYSLSVLATVSDAFLSLLRASCVCVYQGLWQWCGGRLFGLDCFWGIFFRCAMVVLPSFHVIFGWGTLSEIVCEIPTFWLPGSRHLLPSTIMECFFCKLLNIISILNSGNSYFTEFTH